MNDSSAVDMVQSRLAYVGPKHITQFSVGTISQNPKEQCLFLLTDFLAFMPRVECVLFHLIVVL